MCLISGTKLCRTVTLLKQPWFNQCFFYCIEQQIFSGHFIQNSPILGTYLLVYFPNALHLFITDLRNNCSLNGVNGVWRSTFLPYLKNCLDYFYAEGHKHINTSPVVLWEPCDIYKNEHQNVIQEAEWTSFILSNATVLSKLQGSSVVSVLPTISHTDVSLIDGQALIREWWELHLGRMRGLRLIDFRGRLDNSWLLSSALTFKGCAFQHEVKEWFRPFV